MQSKGLSLKMQFLLLSCVLSMVLAAANADSSSSSSSSSSESSGSDSMEDRRPNFVKIIRQFFQLPGRRSAREAYQAQV